MASLNTNNKQKQQALESKALNEQISLKIDSFISKQQVILETFLVANTNDEFSIYVKSLNGSNTITVTSISFNAHTL